MPRFITEPFTILNAKAATGVGTAFACSDCRNITLALSSDTHATFTVKFQASDSKTCPDFSAAKSPTNVWDYVQVKDLQDNSATNGDTGVPFADDDVQRFEINQNASRWVNAEVYAYTDGKIYLTATGWSDQ